MSLARVGWTVALVALAACGGGGSAAGGARGTFVPPAQVGSTSPPTPSSATSTATYTSAGATIAFPSAGGYSGTIKLPISGMLSVATMTMTTSTAIPGGFPTILDRRTAGRRYTLSSVLAPQLYETLNSSDSVVFNALSYDLVYRAGVTDGERFGVLSFAVRSDPRRLDRSRTDVRVPANALVAGVYDDDVLYARQSQLSLRNV